MTSHGKVCRRDLQGAVNRVRVWEPGTKQVQHTLVPGLNFWLCHLKDRFGAGGGAYPNSFQLPLAGDSLLGNVAVTPQTC